MSMRKSRSKSSLKRADSSHPDDLDAIPCCTSIKVIGDPVDGIRYKQSQYDFNLKKLISLELKSDESIDTVDVDGKSPTIKKQELGFDLMSLTSARGHFVDKVKPSSKAEAAGLKHADLILEVNGSKVRDMPHEELVTFIRQQSMEDASAIHLTIISKINHEETLTEEHVDNAIPESNDEKGGFVDPGMNKTQQKYAPAYQPAYQPPQQTVIVQNVHFGPRPMTMICTECQSQIVTRTESEPGVTAWILGLVLCCICWPLSCVPCCIDSLQDVTHKCPNCKKTIGTYKA